jgi:23S rRNA (cytidine1920-2'-O)/16S rRNA (cytidine1409-2'-O)-methyltransferase
VTSQRLDEALVARGLSPSRSRARDAVARGTVFVNGVAARKPSQSVTADDTLSANDPAQHYVSRAALKLVHGLDHFGVDVTGCHALDVGASTGGFTQVLLERGAAHVVALDVGHGQMVPALANDPRVTLREGVNARDATIDDVPPETNLVVCDVSFISLKLVLPTVLSLTTAETQLLALIKPQFEVGRGNVGRSGLVTDPAQHQRVCDGISAMLQDLGWDVKGVIDSPLEGGDGNHEFLLMAVRAP